MSTVAAPPTSSPGRDLPALHAVACRDRYARLLVEHGVGLRPGQQLFVRGQRVHRDMALRIGEAAYALGASEVRYHLPDPRQLAQLVRLGTPEQLAWHHERDREWHAEVLRVGGAVIFLAGAGLPRWLAAGVDAASDSHDTFIRYSTAASLEFWSRAVDARLCPGLVAVSPTAAWARRVFPELPPTAATRRLSELIWRVSFADRDDGGARLAERDALLHARRRRLDALGITELVVEGGGNSLRIGLSPAARWIGGSVETLAGQRFYPNLPSFEIYTTPDRRRVDGRFAASRPFRLRTGVLVRDLALTFRSGRVVAHAASTGRAELARELAVDDGAACLGEIALVGLDSPLAQSGLFFDQTLCDENAASHVALGQAYAGCLAGGPSLEPATLRELGCNRSAIHCDIPFGSPAVTVRARTAAGGEELLIHRGRWTDGAHTP